jgi:hypothetical protein
MGRCRRLRFGATVMAASSSPPGRCGVPGCPATYAPYKWGQIRAQSAGWFFPKDPGKGGPWCPEHLPDWVAAWRARAQ